MTKIVKFPTPSSAVPSRSEVIKYLNDLGSDISDMLMWDPTLSIKWRENNLDAMQILEVIKDKNIVDGPRLDKHGDWVIELEKKWVGRRKVRVTVAVGKHYLDVIKVT